MTNIESGFPALFDFDKYKKIYYNIYRKSKERRIILMPVEVLKALFTIMHFCLEQDNCNECPMKAFCGKIPCEFDS